MITFKIGIVGAGKIAHTVADTLVKLEGFDIAAIAARDLDRAEEFAKEFNVPKAYGSYEELANDPEVELVYITTINSTHADIAKMCLNAGKPVLVEKPISYNVQTTQELFALAEEKKLFCGEAMWTRYMPMMTGLIDVIHIKKLIGDVKMCTANLGYYLLDKERITKPEMAGGALLDLGIYPITFIFVVMGTMPVSISSSYSRLNTGVDVQDVIQMTFKDGQQAIAYANAMGKTDNKGMIYGTKGYIEVDNVNCPTLAVIYDKNGVEMARLAIAEKQISGYEFEFLAAREAIITGSLETEVYKRDHIMQIQHFMQTLRMNWNITFPLPGEPVPVKNDETPKMDPSADFRNA